jgi:hypothetical protein
MNSNTRLAAVTVAVALANVSAGQAQAASDKKQVVKPPVAQAWIDVATFSGMGLPGMGGMTGGGAVGANPMAMLGGMFGGGGKNDFGNTKTGANGSWVDVTLFTRNNPNLTEAVQTVPQGSRLAPELKLVAPRMQKAERIPDDDEVVREEDEPPKGKVYLYWGCGDTVRPGQPRMLDMSKASVDEFKKFFVSRSATQRGAHLAAGRPAWPNKEDDRLVPSGASLVGEHAFKGQGVPDSLRFAIGPAQDIMPALELSQRDSAGATRLEWKRLPTARAYFLSAMGSKGPDDKELVFWTSSEQPELGTRLIDYQTNPAVDRWLKDGVLLSPGTRTCVLPKGIFGEGAMLRMIAYGSELNLAHPPRPADPRTPWEPEWAVKVRVKSVATTVLGAGDETDHRQNTDVESTGDSAGKSAAPGATDDVGEGLKKLKGLFGF